MAGMIIASSSFVGTNISHNKKLKTAALFTVLFGAIICQHEKDCFQLHNSPLKVVKNNS